MKAIRIHEHGGVDALKWDNIPKPELSVNQVLIDVKATSLNHLDIWVRKGIPGVPLPLITGSDAAGIISRVGDGVKKSRIGEKVMIQPLKFCGECAYCKKRKENCKFTWNCNKISFIKPAQNISTLSLKFWGIFFTFFHCFRTSIIEFTTFRRINQVWRNSWNEFWFCVFR